MTGFPFRFWVGEPRLRYYWIVDFFGFSAHADYHHNSCAVYVGLLLASRAPIRYTLTLGPIGRYFLLSPFSQAHVYFLLARVCANSVLHRLPVHSSSPLMLLLVYFLALALLCILERRSNTYWVPLPNATHLQTYQDDHDDENRQTDGHTDRQSFRFMTVARISLVCQFLARSRSRSPRASLRHVEYRSRSQ